jgi:hypothetical protein
MTVAEVFELVNCVPWVFIEGAGVGAEEYIRREFRTDEVTPAQELGLAPIRDGDRTLSGSSFGFTHADYVVHEVHIAPKQRQCFSP